MYLAGDGARAWVTAWTSMKGGGGAHCIPRSGAVGSCAWGGGGPEGGHPGGVEGGGGGGRIAFLSGEVEA